jgi:prepilin-type N-terminal cleavage/methylation domain-containing protein
MRKHQKGFSLIELLIVVAIILIIAAIAIPNLLRSKMAANEASAVGTIRTINTAAVMYSTTFGSYPPTLSSLGPSTSPTSTASDLVSSPVASGTKSGYRFTLTAGANNLTYSITGSPTTANITGQRYFYSDQSGVIRYNLTTTAASTDNPLN